MVGNTVTWPMVVLALITGLPAILAAVVAILNRKQLVTGNDKTVGEMVTETHGALSAEATPYDTHRPDSRAG